MAGTYKPIEVGVCEQGSIPDRGTWYFRTVTVPALTPPEALEQIALERYLEKFGDTIPYKFWVQSVGEATKVSDEELLMSESDYVQ